VGAAATIPTPTGQAGTIYLIHLEEGLVESHGSTHYIGWTRTGRLHDRINEHAEGGQYASPLLRAATERGIRWTVVRLWHGADRHFERKLKRRRKAKALCPVCRGEVTFESTLHGEAEVTYA